jgi:hypothetical protein
VFHAFYFLGGAKIGNSPCALTRCQSACGLISGRRGDWFTCAKTRFKAGFGAFYGVKIGAKCRFNY